ncbi:hypothetical protein LCGC14_2917280 [marine sediment metagenome]|uniref:DNRLRE domain-containing protein n=1 Tax=marine sediment metagenome TaxID=412755 RepID=A0A0F8XQ25_9ZZZZ
MSTETLRPNAVGDETSISDHSPSSGEHWDKVDEETTDDLATYIITTSGLYERDLFNLPASSGSGTINFIKIYLRCKGNGAYFKLSLKSNSTVTDGTEVLLTSSPWKNSSEQWNTNPADAAAWEWADIDTLQIGVALNSAASTAICTQVYVEVDYTASVWANKFNGVANASIGKINGIAIADILKVNSVE